MMSAQVKITTLSSLFSILIFFLISKYFLISFYAPNFYEPYVQELPQTYAKEDAELHEVFIQSPVC